MINVLKSENYEVRDRAALTLGQIGTPAIEPLLALLKDKSASAQSGAAQAIREMALRGIRDPRVVEPLIDALKDEDAMVREKAASALGNMGDKGAVNPLIEALKDENVYVRQEAAYALGNINLI